MDLRVKPHENLLNAALSFPQRKERGRRRGEKGKEEEWEEVGRKGRKQQGREKGERKEQSLYFNRSNSHFLHFVSNSKIFSLHLMTQDYNDH